jgi:hypothetical protein
VPFVLGDILIAAAIFFAQLVTAWYGIHVSVKENRLRNAFIIGFVGAIGLAFTVWGVIRSAQTQADLKTQLNTIQHNTETPPQITVTPPERNGKPSSNSSAHLS